MQSTIDDYELELSQSTSYFGKTDFNFKEKRWVKINDNNQGNYPGQQVKFQCIELANSKSFTSWAQNIIFIPLVLNTTLSTAIGQLEPCNIFAHSLKNGAQHLIESVIIQFNDVTMNSQQPMANIPISFELLKMSKDQQFNLGDLINYNIDTPTIFYQAASNAYGLGECNNVINGAAFAAGSYYGQPIQNTGRLNRMISLNYDATATAVAGATTYGTDIYGNYKSCVDVNSQTQIRNQILLALPCCILNDLFMKIPMIRGLKVYITLTLNTGCSTVLTTNAAGTQYSNAANAFTVTSPNSTLPYMLSPIGGGLVVSTAAATTITTNLYLCNTGSGNNAGSQFGSACYMLCSQFDLNPEDEEKYISSPIKTIDFLDYTLYPVTGIGAGNSVNQLLSSGISRIRDIIILPVLSSASNGGVTDAKRSPFSTSPSTSIPYVNAFQNFQIELSGEQVFKQGAIFYGYENFIENVRSSVALNGGSFQSIGLASGLINKSYWENGYQIAYVDLSRKQGNADDNLSKSVKVLFKNDTAVTIDYYVFIRFVKQCKLNINTGSFVD